MSVVHTESSCFSYVPPLLPDELMYSWLGRLSALNAWGTGRHSARKIFGDKSFLPSIDLPTHLAAMQGELGILLPCKSLTEFIETATLLPYHRPFLEPARYEQVVQTLLYGNAAGLKARMGLAANRFGTKPALRFCARCVDESVAEHGCFYWSRQHHLPGVSCCIRHKLRLVHQACPSLTSPHRVFLYPGLPTTSEAQTYATRHELNFAVLSRDLLSAGLVSINPADRSSAYRNEALARGYRSTRGHVSYSLLAEAMRQHFDDFQDFDHRERILSTTVHPLRWLHDLFERPQRSVHPICHLLLIDFLFGSVANFQAAAMPDMPALKTFESVAYPAAGEEGQCSSSRSDADIESMLCDLSLSCRQVAQRTGKCVTTIVKYRRMRALPIKERRQTLSSSKIESICKYLQMGLEIPTAAKRAGVSISTVYRELARNPTIVAARNHCSSSSERIYRQECWLRVLRIHGSAGIIAAKAHAKADYAWLYRHDREWLLATNAPFHMAPKPIATVDWNSRDHLLCRKAIAIAQALYILSPPVRVSMTRLQRSLEDATVTWNHRPLTGLSCLLDHLAESQSSFGKRRVDYAIEKLQHSGCYTDLWRIKRAAGLRKWPADVLEYANQRIGNFSKN